MQKGKIFSDWDVRLRLAAALIWIIGLLFIEDPRILPIPFLILLCLISADSGIALNKAGKQLIHAMPFVLLMFVTLAISDGFPITADALTFAILLSGRVLIGVTVVLAMIGGSTADEFIRGISVLPIPQVILSLLFLVNRYIDVLGHDFRQQRLSLKSRMFVPKAGFGALKNIGFVVGGMFIRGYDRAEQVYAAMSARSFSGIIPYEEAGAPSVLDVLKLVFACALLAGILIVEKVVMI